MAKKKNKSASNGNKNNDVVQDDASVVPIDLLAVEQPDAAAASFDEPPMSIINDDIGSAVGALALDGSPSESFPIGTPEGPSEPVFSDSEADAFADEASDFEEEEEKEEVVEEDPALSSLTPAMRAKIMKMREADVADQSSGTDATTILNRHPVLKPGGLMLTCIQYVKTMSYLIHHTRVPKYNTSFVNKQQRVYSGDVGVNSSVKEGMSMLYKLYPMESPELSIDPRTGTVSSVDVTLKRKSKKDKVLTNGDRYLATVVTTPLTLPDGETYLAESDHVILPAELKLRTDSTKFNDSAGTVAEQYKKHLMNYGTLSNLSYSVAKPVVEKMLSTAVDAANKGNLNNDADEEFLSQDNIGMLTGGNRYTRATSAFDIDGSGDLSTGFIDPVGASVEIRKIYKRRYPVYENGNYREKIQACHDEYTKRCAAGPYNVTFDARIMCSILVKDDKTGHNKGTVYGSFSLNEIRAMNKQSSRTANGKDSIPVKIAVKLDPSINAEKPSVVGLHLHIAYITACLNLTESEFVILARIKHAMMRAKVKYNRGVPKPKTGESQEAHRARVAEHNKLDPLTMIGQLISANNQSDLYKKSSFEQAVKFI